MNDNSPAGGMADGRAHGADPREQDPFLQRLRRLTRLDEGEVNAFADLLAHRVTLGAERTIVSEGDRPERLHILVDGWAARAKLLSDGRRHLCTVLVPGDVCDVDGLHVQRYDYDVVTLSRCTVAAADRRALLALCERNPRIGRALTWLGYLDNSLLNEHAVSMARRSARERVAHLFCEFAERLRAVGRARDDGFDHPLTQEKIADAVGLTAIHVNRTLRDLRRDGLVHTGNQTLTTPDWSGLTEAGGFDAGYLHLEGMR